MSDGGERAYVAGLTLLARRELAEAQLRTRLARRKFDEEDIDAAVARLRRERAVDDRRPVARPDGQCRPVVAGDHQIRRIAMRPPIALLAPDTR